MKRLIAYWILITITLTGLSGLIYAGIQQDLRQTANDPQIQMAEDIATKLTDGQPIQNVVPSEKIDIAKSLAPYVIIFDATGKPIASSAQLHGQIPTIPTGVFDTVKQSGEDRITWQPQPGVRSAVVVLQFQGPNPGFVLVGRSLREVEKREDGILLLLSLGWISVLFVSLLASAIVVGVTAKGSK